MDQYRSDYLNNFIAGLWTQIRHKEESIWKFISFYAAALVFSAGFIKFSEETGSFILDNLAIYIVSITVMITSLWGVLIILDSNFWLQRNLIFIGNVEKELLEAEDFDKILPSSYSDKPDFGYSRSYTLHLYIFFLLLLASMGLIGVTFIITDIGSSILSPLFLSLYFLLFSLGFLYIIYRDSKYVDRFYDVREQSPGRPVNAKKQEQLEAVNGEPKSAHIENPTTKDVTKKSHVIDTAYVHLVSDFFSLYWVITLISSGVSIWIFWDFVSIGSFNDPIYVISSLVLPILGIIGFVVFRLWKDYLFQIKDTSKGKNPILGVWKWLNVFLYFVLVIPILCWSIVIYKGMQFLVNY